MPLSKEMIALATLGTENSVVTAPSMDGELGQVLGRMQDASPEARLLATIAGIKLREQAGYLPSVIDKPVPEPCEPEDLPPCSPQAMRHLMVMREGHFDQCIPEWLRVLAQSDRRAPEEILPLLLETGRKRPDLRDLIVPVLGKRGEWLAQEVTNRNWNWFSPRNIDSRWSRGKDETRIELIEMLRKHDPAHARELVMESWETDDPITRAKFIRSFESGLSLDDEPLLETCLDDKRKEVREPAQQLLLRLPESRLVQRMIERATPLVTLGKAGLRRKPAIEVTYPTELTVAMRRDGIEKWAKGARFEEDAYYLTQLLTAVRPTFWCECWSMSAEELYEAMMNSSESELLFYAWTQAAVCTDDAEFAEILLNYHLEHLASLELELMADLVAHEIREALAMNWLQKYKDSLKNIQNAGPLLAHHRITWSDELSHALIENLDRYLSKGRVRPPRDLREITKIAAAHVSTALRTEFLHVLETETSSEKLWTDLVDEIRLLLDFRQEMLTAIYSSEGD